VNHEHGLDRGRLGLFFLQRFGEAGGHGGGGPDDFLLEPLGANLVERAGRDLGGSNAQLLGLRENFFVLEAKFLRNIVNTNGHK
jgi:hypothetical protein